jgi:hypothetical protein
MPENHSDQTDNQPGGHKANRAESQAASAAASQSATLGAAAGARVAAGTAVDQQRDGPAHLAENAIAPETPAQIPDEQRPTEVGGQKGLEPTRYGDWEKRGRCTDF